MFFFWQSKSASDMTVVVGQHRLENQDGTEQTFEIDFIMDHPDYHFHDTEHDISLVKLKGVAKLNDYVIPACIPEKGEVFEGYYCIVTGWGHDEESKYNNLFNISIKG
jgi:hypothetical protein